MTEPTARPPFYPVSLDVSGHTCLVVGGGTVAARKARTLLDCGAVVTVIAPSLGGDMEALIPALHALERRPYRRDDASSFRLVVTATGIAEVDGAVYADAEAAGVWANSADDLAFFSFIFPAVHRDGAVRVGLDGRAQSRPRLMAPDPPGRRVRGRTRDPGATALYVGTHLKRAGLRSDSVDSAASDGPLPELVRSGDIDGAREMVAAATGL